MKPKISIITLTVADLGRATEFYRDGLKLPLVEQESDGIAFFSLEGTWLALYPRDAMAEDIGVDVSGSGFGGFTLAHNVATKADVDAVLSEAVAAGATLVKAAEEVFWGGYSGYFQDLDGHYWEVAYNPFTDLS